MILGVGCVSWDQYFLHDPLGVLVSIDVAPLDDLKPHLVGAGGACWCHPRVVDEEGVDVILHYALDQRERYADPRARH